MKRILVLLLVLALLALSQSAFACPMCFAPKNAENLDAFMLMTGFMSLLPLGLIGAGIFWLKRHFREFERRSRAARRLARDASRAAASAERARVASRPAPVLRVATGGYLERGF